MTTAIVNIPLNKLAQFEGNVRKTQNKSFIDELAASIKASVVMNQPMESARFSAGRTTTRSSMTLMMPTLATTAAKAASPTHPSTTSR